MRRPSFDADFRKVLTAEWADRIAFDIFAGQGKRSGVRQGYPQRLLLDLRLRLFVQLAAYTLLAGGLASADELVQAWVAVTGEVGARLHGRAGKLRGQEVVRVAVVAGPAHEQQVMFPGLGPTNQFAPLDHADFRLDADLCQVRLEQLRAKAGVGVEQAAGGARPESGFEAVLEAGLGQ